MSHDDLLRSLHQKHAKLENTLQQEENRPLPDAAIIQDLKRKKLAIKDEIANIEHG